MEEGFLNSSVNCELLLKNQNGTAEKYVLINNEASIKKIYTFFTSDKSVLLLNGFAGTGKKQILETFLENTKNETVVCKFGCCESSTINDLYLYLSTYFKKHYKSELGNDFNILTDYKEKVQYAFSRLETRIILVLYNFDNILEENKSDFINYLNALTDLKKIKIIIEARVFDSALISPQSCYSKVMIKALSKELFEEYYKNFDIKLTSNKFEQLYRLTRGYFLYCCITLRLLINQGISADDFLTKYFASGLSYDTFIAQQYYKLLIGTTKNAFNLFVQLRHGINKENLLEIAAYPENVLKTLSENFFIHKIDEMYYPSNFLKEQLKPDIKDVVYKSKLIKYYTAQSEKSLEERDFIISRESLANEIAFCSNACITPEQQRQKNSQSQQKIIEPSKETKEEVKKENEEILKLSPQELLSKANDALLKFDYIQSLKYLSAILMNKETYNDTQLINSSYHLLVTSYTKLGKYEYALYYLKILEDYYEKENELDNLYSILYEKSYILYKQNKVIDAINLLKKILSNTTTKFILTKTNLLIGNIALLANNRPLGMNYIKSAIDNITDTTEDIIKSELYFKYALLSDEYGNEERAFEYYNKCTQMDTTPNKYMALSYSNMGEIYYDKEDIKKAKINFQKANDIEKTIKNDYGVYYTLTKIVELTPREEKDLRIKLMTDARNYAIASKDNETIIESTTMLGDMYYDYSMPQDALIEYFNLYTQGKDIIEKTNLEKIKARIRDIKARIRKDEFEKLAPNYE
jgi:hypothetical protein